MDMENVEELQLQHRSSRAKELVSVVNHSVVTMVRLIEFKHEVDLLVVSFQIIEET